MFSNSRQQLLESDLKACFWSNNLSDIIERNDRLYKNANRVVITVQKHIFEVVRCEILGLTHIGHSQGHR